MSVPDRVVAALRAVAERPICAYVYHRQVLRDRAAQLRSALPAGTRLLYAVKANGHPEVIQALAPAVDGFEVASGGELALAQAARSAVPGGGLIAFSGPAKTDAELSAAVRAGAVLHVESALELHRLDVAARRAGAGAGATVAIRVNRGGAVLPGSHQMTGGPTPFGVDEAQLPAVLALAARLPTIRLVGYHLHAVSNNLDAAAHAAFVRAAVDWAARVDGGPPEYLNVGGGLGVDYTGPGRFDLAAFAAGLAGLRGRVVLEPGRYLAADAGWYATEVLDLKRTHGRWFAVVRGGTHHFRLPAAWGYSHPFTVLSTPDWPYPFARPELRDSTVDVVGELCTPRDVLARDAPVDRLRVGDVVVFGRTGAYGWDISHHEFLRHRYPRMIVI